MAGERVLKLNIVGDTESLQKALNKAQSSAGLFEGGLSGVFSKLKGSLSNISQTLEGGLSGLAGSLSGVAEAAGPVGAAIGIVGAASLGVAAAIDKASDKTIDWGKQVIGLQRMVGGSAESVSQLSYVFQRYNIDTGEAGRLIKSMTKDMVASSNGANKAEAAHKKYNDTIAELNKQLAGATDKEKEAIQAKKDKALATLNAALATAKESGELSKLGIQVKDSNGHFRNYSDVIADLSDKFKKMKDPVEKNAAVAKIFGKQWRDMLPVLDQGKKGLTDLTAEAKKYGFVLSESNEKDIKNYIKASKELDSATQGLQIQFGQIAIPLKTFLAKEGAQYFSWLVAAKPAMEKVASFVKDTFVPNFGEMSKELKGIGKDLSNFGDIGENVVKSLWKGISKDGDWLKNNITKFFKDHLPGPVLKVLGIKSPSTVFMDIGKNVVLGLAQGIMDSAGIAQNALTSLTPGALSFAGATDVAFRDFLGSSSVNITITGNYINDRYDIERIGDDLVTHLRRKGVKF